MSVTTKEAAIKSTITLCNVIDVAARAVKANSEKIGSRSVNGVSMEHAVITSTLLNKVTEKVGAK